MLDICPKPRRPAWAATLLSAALLAAIVLTLKRNAMSQSMPAAGLLLASASGWPLPQDSRLEVLRGCSNFACLRAAQALPRSPGEQFNFPHFVIAGYPKCATSSLAGYFAAHPQAVGPSPKEPYFFTRNGNCTHPSDGSAPARWGCDQRAQQHYLLDTLHRDVVANSGLTRAAFEASVAYAFAPPDVVAGIWRELPWLKVVVSMREPISQKMSSIVHWGELMMLDPRPGWFQRLELDRAVIPRRSCSERLFKNAASMYECLVLALNEPPELQGEYHANLPVWLAHSPRQQFYVVQYENLTTHTAAVLADLQRFLGLDPALAPAELPPTNIRKTKYAGGWPMTRREYEHLLSIARPRAQQAAAVLEQHGFAGARDWLAPWEAAWQNNLDRCSTDGDCLIQLT